MIFQSLFDLGKNVADVVLAPVEIVVDVAEAITKPVAEAAQEVVQDVKEELGGPS